MFAKISLQTEGLLVPCYSDRLEKGIDSEGKMQTLRKRCVIDPVEATAITLRRLSTANKLIDLQPEFWTLQPEFWKQRSALSEIFYHALKIFYCDFGSALETWQQSLVFCGQEHTQNAWRTKAHPLTVSSALSMVLESRLQDPVVPVSELRIMVTRGKIV
jgi:hypothetical protein